VEDTSFKEIDVIPLGADKVFIHSLSSVNVSKIVGKAKSFLILFSQFWYVGIK